MSERRLRVFLCHASQDKPVVRELYQRLLAEGWIDPWLDEEKLLPGQDWDFEIKQEVEITDVVIVFLSKNSVTKEGYIQKELRKVLDVADEKPEGANFVIPLKLDECIPPRRIQIWQYQDFSHKEDQERAYMRIISSLRKRAETLGINSWRSLISEFFLPHLKKRYIDRGEISIIEDNLNQARKENFGHKSIKALLFRGHRGFGKTWLSLHLHRTVIPEMTGVKSLYISLCPLPEEYQQTLRPDNEWSISSRMQDPEDLCLKLLLWICRCIGIENPPNPTFEDLQNSLITEIEKQLKLDMLVLIFDSVFEADWSVLQILESKILDPLTRLSNTFFIMTGGGRSYPWISPGLRIGLKEYFLESFEKSHIEKLLSLDTLFKISGGSPLVASYLLWKSDQDPVDSINEIINILLQLIPPHSRKEIRSSLEVLSVLDGFREEEMLDMLRRNNNTSDQNWDTANIRVLRDTLIRAGLLTWKDGGYTIDETMKFALRNYVQIKKHAEWLHLVSTAHHMYLSYSESYPKYKDYFVSKADAYRAEL